MSIDIEPGKYWKEAYKKHEYFYEQWIGPEI